MEINKLELLKQLKDAGFPQKSRCDCPDCKGIDGDAYPPTLSELIEACGDDFYILSNNPFRVNTWLAQSTPRKVMKDATASTPEEAVAKLYLSLYA